MKTLIIALILMLVVESIVLTSGVAGKPGKAGVRYSIESRFRNIVPAITCFFQSLSVSLSRTSKVQVRWQLRGPFGRVAGDGEGLFPPLNQFGRTTNTHQGWLKYTATFSPDYAGISVQGTRCIGCVVKCAG